MEIADQTNTTTTKSKKKKKNHSRESQLRYSLDTCSKNNDLHGALSLYESAVSDKIHLAPYHFNTLLHICAASIETVETSTKRSVIDAGFRIFDHMVSTGASPTEATITSVARIASQDPNASGAQFAFDLVKTMGEKFGALPKLRTFGPALLGFCRRGDADNAYAVEAHMVLAGIVPDEPEIAALLKVSNKEGRGDKVYEYLQKLRSSVRFVAEPTASILEEWFRSERAASMVGSSIGDAGKVKDTILRNGGGWHGIGFLGEGKWEVSRASVCSKGRCSCCERRLACVDIDRVEREKFMESIANLALEREVKANFRNFQDWLENHTEYEAIVDGANVGFYQQNFAEGSFSLSQCHNPMEQLDSVVKELCERSSGKWPLIILHNKRVNMLTENPSNRQLIETWRANGALYATPNGSNDDWYWLYAAVKLKCLLVTNDEMRDHIFELLGKNFFHKWKEHHQVRYTFTKGVLKLLMPPPYSSVIQESEIGSWHVPLDDKCSDEGLRNWLCITRHASNSTPSEADIVMNSTQTSVICQKTPLFPDEDVNILQKSSPMIHPCNHKEPTINGKRKARSPSSSEA